MQFQVCLIISLKFKIIQIKNFIRIEELIRIICLDLVKDHFIKRTKLIYYFYIIIQIKLRLIIAKVLSKFFHLLL